MSNIVELPTEKRFEQACDWIARMDNAMSDEDQLALEQWLAASKENQSVLLKVAKLWDKFDSLERLADLFPQPIAQPVQRSWIYPAIAASILTVALAGAWFVGGLSGIDSLDRDQTVGQIAITDNKEYETAIGEQSNVNFTDGTQVLLNTNSLITVTFSEQYRLIELERGELHVQVAHDPSRPLSVIAGGKVIRAVGTAFNVQISPSQQVELIVTEGKVRVLEASSNEFAVTAPEKIPPNAMAVAQGGKVVLGVEKEVIETVTNEDIEADLSWRSGNLIFQGESLEDAISEISRYTPIKFEIVDDSLRDIQVAGLFKAGDVKGLLQALSKNFNIASERVGEKKILLSVR
jgi:transmembrane sensor